MLLTEESMVCKLGKAVIGEVYWGEGCGDEVVFVPERVSSIKFTKNGQQLIYLDVLDF